jgi:hypothetical protein
MYPDFKPKDPTKEHSALWVSSMFDHYVPKPDQPLNRQVPKYQSLRRCCCCVLHAWPHCSVQGGVCAACVLCVHVAVCVCKVLRVGRVLCVHAVCAGCYI